MTDYLDFTVDWSNPGAVASYDELPLWSAMAGLLMLEHLPLRPGIVALDVGPGTGFPLLDLAQRLGRGATVVGLDPWAEALARARLKQRVWGVRNAHIVLGDAAAMPFPDGSFDCVLSLNTIHNLYYYQTLMAGMRDAIASGGFAAFAADFQRDRRTGAL